MKLLQKMMFVLFIPFFSIAAIEGRMIVKDTLEVNPQTLNNTETPNPTAVAVHNVLVAPAYNEATETAAAYCKLTYRGTSSNDFINCLYFETAGYGLGQQSQVSGAPIKIVHRGHGDAVYVALLGRGSSGYGYESAGFGGWQDAGSTIPKQENLFLGSFQGSGGFQESVKNQSNTIAFHALVHDDATDPTTPNVWATGYGLFFANNSLANAMVVRVSQYAANYPQIKIMDYTANQRPRFSAYGNGELYLDGLEAKAGAVNKESPEFQLRGKFWTGAVESTRASILKTYVDGAGVPYLRTYVGTSGSETLVSQVSAAGLDMQNHTIVGAHGLTLYSGGTGIDMQLQQVANLGSLKSAGTACASLPGAGNAYTIVLVPDAGVGDKPALCVDDGAAWKIADSTNAACCP